MWQYIIMGYMSIFTLMMFNYVRHDPKLKVNIIWCICNRTFNISICIKIWKLRKLTWRKTKY